ncbi:ATP-dependent DNA helicase RecQ-like [Mya arenaria]|uniref:ATP-dependent DNA helicase RecQ-like n=1 Tax=Mya arenaria TaxID=6604 RepID=UPI0022E3484F|nr:ATP-dependent DNA helicase RecQ-like [Mya arenaria]
MSASMHVSEEILNKFGIKELKPFQEQTITRLLKGEDVFLCKKTGGGKSICYQAYQPCWTNLHGDVEKCQVLVVCPLLSIMKEQCECLSAAGFSATYIGTDRDDEEALLNGDFQFVYTSPEHILGVSKWNGMFRSTTSFQLLVMKHIQFFTGGSSEKADIPFRPWFSKLGKIRSLIDCPVLLITATANKAARMKLQSMFCMKSCFEIIDNPDLENIKLFVTKVKSTIPLSEIFFFIIQKVKAEKDTCERYIIFCQSIKSCSEIFTMFRLQLGLEIHYIEMFHSNTSDEVKENVKKNMNDINGSIRILAATSAAGMGVNFQGVKHVVNCGPPADMDSFVQQYGRAGRDGSFATGLLIYNAKQCKKNDMDMKNYLDSPDSSNSDSDWSY